MKTKEELLALKNEFETASKKLPQLTEEKLAQVAGGDSQGRMELEKYLKTLCPDKSRILVDHGEGKKLVPEPSVKFEDNNNVSIIPRE